MYGETKVTGIVLSAMPVGEYDRRVSILTVEKGRISAFAQYSRRPKSTLRACTQPFVYGTFTIREGKDSNNLVACENADYFDDIKNDLDSMYYSMYFCEIMEYLTREGNDEKEQVKLLYVSLKAILKKIVPIKLVRRIFEIRALSNFGEAPNVFACALCGSKETGKFWFFDHVKSQLVCDDCASGAGGDSHGYMVISEATRYALHYCITCMPQKLYSFELKDSVYAEFENVIRDYVSRHIDKRMKSLDVIEMTLA